jgi:hypothetical protein
MKWTGFLAVAAVTVAVPASAHGAIIVGSDLSQAGGADYCTGTGPGARCTVLQLTLGTTDQAVPVDGTITSWAVRDAGGELSLRVIDGAPGQRRVVAAGPPVHASGAGVQSFPAAIPVHAGQRIGLEVGEDGQVPIRYRDEQTTGERYLPQLGADPALPISTDVSRTYELLYNATIQTAGGSGSGSGSGAGSGSPTAGGGSPTAGAGCPTAGVVARGSDSIVYRSGKRLVGCRAGTTTPIGTPNAHTQFRLLRFNGDAFALVRVVDHRSFIQIYDLAAGRRTFTTPRTFSRGRPTSWTVRSLVVATSGAAAWISTLAGSPDKTTVWIHSGRKVQQIDTGRLRARSLRLTADGRSIEYKDAAGRTRDSSLG